MSKALVSEFLIGLIILIFKLFKKILNLLLNSINKKDLNTKLRLNINFKNCRNWEPGQPDNWQGAPAGTEDCAEFYEGYPGTWNDQTCGYTRFYVCERDVNAGII